MAKRIYNLQCLYNEDDISYYLLGVFMTDGCVYSRGKKSYAVDLTSKDRNWLVAIKKLICPKMKIYEQIKETGNIAYSLCFYSTEMGKWLISKGCTPRKTLTLKFPKNIPTQYLPDFIRGCFDGDGCIGFYETKKKTKTTFHSLCNLTSASFSFISKMNKIINKTINCNVSVLEHSNGKNISKIGDRIITSKNKCYFIQFALKTAYNLLKFIYYNNHKISLNRKKKLAIKIINYYENEHIPKKLLPVPSKKDLLKMLKSKPILQIAQDFQVTQKVIYRWMKVHKIEKFGKTLLNKFQKRESNGRIIKTTSYTK